MPSPFQNSNPMMNFGASTIINNSKDSIISMEPINMSIQGKNQLCLVSVSENGNLKVFALGQKDPLIFSKQVFEKKSKLKLINLKSNESYKWIRIQQAKSTVSMDSDKIVIALNMLSLIESKFQQNSIQEFVQMVPILELSTKSGQSEDS